MKVVVFGASGKVGRRIVGQLLDNGHKVTAFVHHNSPFQANTQNLQIIKGDIHKLADVKKAVAGNDKVVSALGSWGTKQKDIVSAGTGNIIEAMTICGVKRIVTVTGSEAWASGDKLSLWNRLTHAVVKCTPVRRIMDDGEAHLRLLHDSQLNWIVLRSPIMNSWGKPEGFVITDRRPAHWITVNRRSVALAMVELLSSQEQSCQAPYISRRKKL
ncbi:MAG: NAD(P)H-binding protein [Candidatus Saccharimonadales bacterium]